MIFATKASGMGFQRSNKQFTTKKQILKIKQDEKSN
jgi:hypothetical protein